MPSRTLALIFGLILALTPSMAGESFANDVAQTSHQVPFLYQLAQRAQETLPCSPNCDSALSGNERIIDKNLDGAVTRDEFRGPEQMFGLIDADKNGRITQDEFEAFKNRGGAAAARSQGQSSTRARLLNEAEIRQTVAGNTLSFAAPSNGQNMKVYFAENGDAFIKVAGKGQVVKRSWFINDKGMLCRTFGKANKKHCTRVQSTDNPEKLTLLNPKLQYEATLTKGRSN